MVVGSWQLEVSATAALLAVSEIIIFTINVAEGAGYAP